MDNSTVMAIIGSIFASKEMLLRLFGPTIDVVANDMSGLVERMNINLEDVFTRSLRKGQSEEGEVPLRVARDIISEGQIMEDEVAKEYIAGILSSSKGHSDKGVSYCAIIKQMSSLEIRLHYMIYYLLHLNIRGTGKSITMEKDRNSIVLMISMNGLSNFFNQPANELTEILLPYGPVGLIRHELIGPLFQYGNPEHLQKWVNDANEPGLLVTPSILGAELFLWAAGFGNKNANFIFDGTACIESKFPVNMQFKNEVKFHNTD